MEDNKIIERLRKVEFEDVCTGLCDEAADLIERLQKELQAANRDMNHIACSIANCNEFLSGGIDKVKGLKLGRCDVCKGICHEDKGCHFEWRGIEVKP